MLSRTAVPYDTRQKLSQCDPGEKTKITRHNAEADQALATAITKAASLQTYYTIQLLVDRDRIADAFRAYGYFRWLDDTLDRQIACRAERIAFVEQQKALMVGCLEGWVPVSITIEEQMLAELIASDKEPESGLQAYLEHMFAVMAFDAERRGRLVSQAELDCYSTHLASAVTEALHYFIGHHQPSPLDQARYLAATAAHITHMLRDTYEDVAAGYFNIPCELLSSSGIGPFDIESDPYRTWVKDRVAQARDYFDAGNRYLARVKNWRCRLAGYFYIARFKGILDTIERNGFRLQPVYETRKNLATVLSTGCSVMSLTFRSHRESL